ncbi:hypothetical protein SERLA73DRAFT_176085 [Serpula lacrymans var. lacrymans S7.3]|uniref:Uncharacterized protein n=1 Tax=Serpula lacrymans var. lacrymans (strain S7.3) TaxID=936435 RepID=F8PMA6_SERL3|nr:hypothetical protein SERLA73DRAFT_176085 [Serpula lacrymans var. lacrymans S7.3]
MAILTGVLTASASALTLWKFTHQRRWPFKYVLSYTLTTSLLSWYCQKWIGANPIPLISASTWLLAIHFITLAAVTCSYRVSPFHPLAAFPGPTLHKLSDLVMMYTVSTGYRYLELSALHQQYGDFVRIGPNKLSILSHSIQHQVYKSSRSLDKSLSCPVPDDDIQGLFFQTSREAHGIGRSIWAPAFSQNMMDQYCHVSENSIAQLIDCIERRKDDRNVIDLGTALQHWSFDFNAHFVFGNHSIDIRWSVCLIHFSDYVMCHRA